MSAAVLLSGNMADPHVELIAAEVEALGGTVDLIEESTVPFRLRGEYHEDADGALDYWLAFDGRPLVLEDYAGAYFRHLDADSWAVPDTLGGVDRENLIVTWVAFLRRLAEEKVARLVNPFDASLTNFYKPLQLLALEAAGFQTPRTLVTDDAEAAAAFVDAHDGAVVFKSSSGVRSVVRRPTPADLARLPLLRNAPSLFQEYLGGLDVRVHCVGDRVFAAVIRSSGDDYRYSGDARMQPVELPPDVAERCLRVTADLGLRVSGIDLRLTDDGYYAFEVNPDPAFVFFQRMTGARISRAIAEYLMGGASA